MFDVDTCESGFVYYLNPINTAMRTGDLLAIVSSKVLEDYSQTIDNIIYEIDIKQPPAPNLLTKKAEILISKHKLDLQEIRQDLGHQAIKEADILAYIDKVKSSHLRCGFGTREKIGIIGGVSGGGALIVIDALLKIPSMQASCIFDQELSYVGKEVLGVPIIGNIEKLASSLLNKTIDKVVIAFNRNLEERASLYTQLRQQGVPFCNIIDPSVEIRNQVELGTGNIILAKSYIGAYCQIGDNNFITSGTHLEHGNILGSHCAFGPLVATSGNVTIGDRVRFATGIVVEPDISIGNDVVISSGAVIRHNIDGNKVVKLNYAQTIIDK